MMPMRTPTHPGLIVKYDCILASGRTVRDMAEEWGVSSDELDSFCEGRTPVTEEIARKLNAQFGFSRRMLMRLQENYDNKRQKTDTEI